jgi:hypothetical protein
MMGNPFDLDDSASYRQWRERKLDTAPRRIEDILVALDDPRALTAPNSTPCCNAVRHRQHGDLHQQHRR